MRRYEGDFAPPLMVKRGEILITYLKQKETKLMLEPKSEILTMNTYQILNDDYDDECKVVVLS